MNVYDFDNTIYNGDSSIDFYKFCIKKHIFLIKYLPIQIWWIFKYLFGICEKKECKEKFFIFLNGIETEQEVKRFWEKYMKNIKAWYINQKTDEDLIISASPKFLLEPLCEIIGIRNLIATEVDMNTGKFYSENCYGEEKVKRYYQEFKNIEINRFYTDSISDRPLIEISKKSYIIKKNHIIKWEKYNKRSKSIKDMLFFRIR